LLANFGIDVELQERARNIDWTDLVSGRAAIDYGQRIFQTTLSILTIIVITVYLLIETPRISRFFNQFVPKDRVVDVQLIMGSLERVVGGYIRGQLITSLAISTHAIVLLILRVDNPLAFAVLAGFADIIPIIGALIAVIPPTFSAFEDSPTKAFIVMGLLIGYQQFEDRILVPRVYGSTLNLPPLIVLIAAGRGELLASPGAAGAAGCGGRARVLRLRDGEPDRWHWAGLDGGGAGARRASIGHDNQPGGVMRARFLLTVAVVLLLAAAVPRDARADEGWTIDSFAAVIEIQTDGSLLITERIDVDFGSLQKHGIFRDIPIEYSSPGDDKHNRIYGFEAVSVTDANGSRGSTPEPKGRRCRAEDR
jgi:hypothetical protein